MLGKLIKSEMQATSKLYISLMLGIIVLSVLNSFTMRMNLDGLATSIQLIVMLGYSLITMGTFFIVLVITIQRFYKNLLGDEGYLMFTLPVKTSQLIWGKLIPATIWTFIGTIVVSLSVMILVSDPQFYIEFWNELRMLLEYVGFENSIHISVLAIYAIIYFIILIAGSYLSFYLASAIGHLSNKNRLLSSIAAYIGINLVLFLISWFGAEFLKMIDIYSLFYNMDNYLVAHIFMIGQILYNVVVYGVIFFITNRILSKRLNLE